MRRWRLVRVADSMASITGPGETSSLWGHLEGIDPQLATGFRLYHHELRDIRGVLTNQVHAVLAVGRR